jgi:hypothetical protein
MSKDTATSGEHLLSLVEADPPVGEHFVGTHSDPPSGIDPTKLLRAWEANVAVQRELISVVQKNESANVKMREDNVLTRKIATLCVALVGLIMGISTGLSYATNRDSLSVLRATNENVIRTLRAVRASAIALGAKGEADTAMEPEVELSARRKALGAQREALEAEMVVGSPSPSTAQQLQDVKLREKQIDDGSTPR